MKQGSGRWPKDPSDPPDIVLLPVLMTNVRDRKSPLFGGIRLLRAQLRVQGIAQRIAEQVEAEDGEADGDAREDRDPGRALGIFDGPAAQQSGSPEIGRAHV